MKPLSPRQQQVLDVIWGYVHANDYPPSVWEIGAAMGMRSPATVQRHLEALERAGYIVWDLFAIAIPGSKDDGWRIRLKIGRREFESETRFVHRRDADRAAEAIWKMLLDGP